MKRVSKEVVDFAQSIVDEIGPDGDSMYVNFLNSSRQVEYLEYGACSWSLTLLGENAKNWLTKYVDITKGRFSGKLGVPSKTILYWRVKPEIKNDFDDKELAENGRFSMYFRIYIDTKG